MGHVLITPVSTNELVDTGASLRYSTNSLGEGDGTQTQ
jgi:hypothetical protein